jgi:hypothetical protein
MWVHYMQEFAFSNLGAICIYDGLAVQKKML